MHTQKSVNKETYQTFLSITVKQAQLIIKKQGSSHWSGVSVHKKFSSREKHLALKQLNAPLRSSAGLCM